MDSSKSYLWRNLLEFEIELLEHDKKQLLEQLKQVNLQLHHKYEQLDNLEDIISVKVSLKNLIQALKKVTQYDDLSVKIYALSSLFRNDNDESIEESSKTMNFVGSEMIIFLKNHPVIYSHLHLFQHFNDLQMDDKTLLEHCSIHPKNSFQDLVVDRDINDVIATFYLDEVSPSEMARTNDQDCLLEQAIYQCILSDKIIEYQKKGNQKII